MKKFYIEIETSKEPEIFDGARIVICDKNGMPMASETSTARVLYFPEWKAVEDHIKDCEDRVRKERWV